VTRANLGRAQALLNFKLPWYWTARPKVNATDNLLRRVQLMSAAVDLSALAKDASHRRIWFLSKALESEPFDRALELARAADEFVAGMPSEEPTHSGEALTETSTTMGQEKPVSELEGAPDTAKRSQTTTPRAQLSNEHRERLIDRLVAGAKNSEIATELGLSSKQVQGFRMGSAREIASRRERLQQQHSSEAASADEVIRYLRQQDDVVVPQGNEYLVNGRFQLSLPGLIERANKMRDRQGKPHFKGGAPNGAEHLRLANGHAAF